MRTRLQRAPLTGCICGRLCSLAAWAWARSRTPLQRVRLTGVEIVDRRLRQGEEGPLEVAEADEDALERPEIEQVWTIKARALAGAAEACGGRLPAGAAGWASAGAMPACDTAIL